MISLRARKNIFFVVLFVILISIGMYVKVNAQVVDIAADLQCIPVIPTCGCNQVMGKNGCEQGTNKYMCPCSQTDNGYTTSGFCQVDQKCHATATGGKSPDSGLSQLAQQLGQLLQSLMKGSGSGDGSGSSGTSAQTCTSYTASSDPNASVTNPCTYYVPSSASQITGTTGTTGTSGLSPSDLLTALTGTTYTGGTTGSILTTSTSTGTTNILTSCPIYSTISCPSGQYLQVGAVTYDSNGCQVPHNTCVSNTSTTTATTITTRPGAGASATVGASLSAFPTAGTAPLLVTFTTNAAAPGNFTLNYGDNISTTFASSQTHTYGKNGKYTVYLLNSSGGSVASFVITVANNATSTGNTGITTLIASGTVPQVPSSSTSVSVGSSNGIPSPTQGNIVIGPNGVTILGGQGGQGNNSVVSGFYGSDTFGNGQPQGVIASLCQNRPWASSFISYVIPPSFFDGLCQSRGYQVGASASTASSTPTTAVKVTLQQNSVPAPAAKKQTTPAAPSKTSQPPTTSTSTTPVQTLPPAQATIWAVPSSVPLGSRTSIFWNTQGGVGSCTETSPDGNFTQNSLSGGASTVPLTKPTTFTISCVDTQGNPITNYVTVQISS